MTVGDRHRRISMTGAFSLAAPEAQAADDGPPAMGGRQGTRAGSISRASARRAACTSASLRLASYIVGNSPRATDRAAEPWLRSARRCVHSPLT
jgi:hypothetical protein